MEFGDHCLFQECSIRFKVFSTTSVVSTLGSDVVLPCRLTPEMNAEKMEIRWFKPMYQPYVHLYINGKDDYSIQMPQFTNRTELIKENITRGVFPLRIRNVTAQDSGQYYCFVESTEHHGRTTVLLNVTGSCNMKICTDPPSELKQVSHSLAQHPRKSPPGLSMKTRSHISAICAAICAAVLFVCICICLLLKIPVNGSSNPA
ncbi:selection and upkeep of intraepithelial T-cells protein 1 isoform X2 [Xenopus laevis]|uniref:Selection and upkeep of intraepithelial T-cells protein 1 isoform X2 n=1 Tax=Xenopus laevis TaxID=8355 RepID=A0A8J1LJ47_XENLA|nr:selection and upkeep of intraepithelial T-cells protein 1 isoform X2 [Xenopus laevis]